MNQCGILKLNIKNNNEKDVILNKIKQSHDNSSIKWILLNNHNINKSNINFKNSLTRNEIKQMRSLTV